MKKGPEASEGVIEKANRKQRNNAMTEFCIHDINVRGMNLVVDVNCLSYGRFRLDAAPDICAITLANALSSKGAHAWVFCAGHEGYQATNGIPMWLNNHGVKWNTILGRDKNDRRAESELKEEWIKRCSIKPDNTIAVFESCYHSASLWWSNGFICYHSGP